MIEIKGGVGKNMIIANLMQHANKDKSIASSKLFKAVVTASLISTFSSPLFAEVATDASLGDFNKIATSKVQNQTTTLPSTLFKSSASLGQAKVMSFSGKKTSGQGSVSISLLDSRLPSPEVSDAMVKDYLSAIDKMSGDELIGNYRTWLAMKISISNLVLSAKDGFPSATEKTTAAGLESLKTRQKYVDKLLKSGDLEKINDFRDTIKKEGIEMIPGSNEMEMYRSGFAYAMSIQGVCSVIYNKDFLSNNESGLVKGDGTPVYSSSQELFESFIINHEFSHCETQGSEFIKNQTVLAAKELEKIKTSALYTAMNKEQVLLFSLFSVSYHEYMNEFYADVLGLSKTIRENNLSDRDAVALVNDIIDIRHSVGIKGDLVHATGNLLEKTKRYYEKMGKPFGYDLDGNDSDEKMSKMMSSFSKLPFNDTIKNFTIISSAKNIGNFDFKKLEITPKVGTNSIDHKPLAKLLYVSSYDIGVYTNGLRSAISKFSTGDGMYKADAIIKQYESKLTSDLTQKRNNELSLDY